MTKKKDNTLWWTTGIGAVGGGALNLLKQYDEMKEKGQDFNFDTIDWSRTGVSVLKGAATGFAAGVAIKLVDGDDADDFYPSNYLNKVLRFHSLNQSPDVLNSAVEKRNNIKSFLLSHFQGDLVGDPLNWGSYSHGTANNSNFDLDIIVPFGRQIGTLDEMHSKVHNAMKSHFNDRDVRLVRKQSKSIGVKYYFGGEEIFIDVVPGREINNYKIDKELKLYVAPGSGGEKSSSIKTNTKTHKEEITGLGDEKKLTRLIKIWRDHHSLNFKSIAIRNMVMSAFEEKCYSIPYDIFGKFEMVLQYVSENIESKRIVDSANSSNVISDSMSANEKKRIAEKAEYDLSMLSKDSEYLIKIFPL